ncbi:MAG: DUF2336 domain-containing protein [Alphaproteobacteria bacterium]
MRVAEFVKSLGKFRKPLSYDEEKALARHDDAAVRAKLAARADVRPEILYYLAEDPDPTVRRKIATNTKTPRHADLILARDSDDEVRGSLAEKIARLAPGLSANEQEQLRRMTHEVLAILARDQLPRVRRILAEALKDVADAPPDIISKLARDTEIDVAGPVLAHSPVLSDEELIEIIRTCRIAGPVAAISGRRNLGPGVADAVVETNDVEAVAALLANPSAQIREETLDRIIDRADEVEAWHGPLVHRPKLSPGAVQKLAQFVADSLVEVLQARGDLDADTVKVLKVELGQRLERDQAAERKTGTVDEALAQVHALKAQGKLGEEEIAEALARGDRRFVAAALTVLTNEPMGLVNKVAESKSGRGVVALCWKAGLSMRFATQLQLRFAHIPPSAAINPSGKDDYPMTPDEMNWQIGFFRTMVPAQ